MVNSGGAGIDGGAGTRLPTSYIQCPSTDVRVFGICFAICIHMVDLVAGAALRGSLHSLQHLYLLPLPPPGAIA